MTTPQEKRREYQREYQRARRKADPEYGRKYVRAWAAANPDYAREYQRAWRVSNLEKAREQVRAWRAANPEKLRECLRAQHQRRRASIKTDVSNAPTAKQLADILLDPCLYCGAPAEHVDHFIPLARGGRHVLDNLVAACKACNLSKGAKLPDVEWTGRRT
jgi:5-methylcytosine-specific restriction endonuclease McrA